MPQYVLCPSERYYAKSEVKAELMPAARQRQINEILADHSRHDQRGKLKSWLRSKNLSDEQLGSAAGQPFLTGIEIVTFAEELAEELKHSSLGYNVLPDVPVPLVQPAVAGPPTAEPDPWHLQLVGIDPAHRSATGRGVTVAVLDTGIDDTHPALDSRVSETVEFDPVQGKAKSVRAQDTNGHGTHVAGLLAARDFGIAPDARLVSGIAFPNTAGSTLLLGFAIEWAARNADLPIINVSGGFQGVLAGFQHAFDVAKRAGALVVCAVGNEGANQSRSPANYDAALAVGAVDRDRQVANFSGGGQLFNGVAVPDLVAPGAMVSSCIVGGKYQPWNGTSMAAPIVSGLAALILERERAIPVDDLISKLLGACLDLNQPRDRMGAGLARMVP